MWARRQGVRVGDRGRLPADLVAQYLAAHRSPARGLAERPSPAAPRPAPSSAPSAAGVVIGRTVTAKPRWDWNR